MSFLVLAIVAVTLILMLARPWGVTEAWVTAAGAVAIFATQVVPVAAIPHLIGETSNVLLFLAGMMLLTGIAERAKVFDLLAEGCVRLARERGRVLFINLFLLGAVVTATLSLDVTIIMLTPIVYALTSRRKLDALPFLFSCAFVANTASLVLPVSNLTNLLVYERYDMGFGNEGSRHHQPAGDQPAIDHDCLGGVITGSEMGGNAFAKDPEEDQQIG